MASHTLKHITAAKTPVNMLADVALSKGNTLTEGQVRLIFEPRVPGHARLKG